MAPANGLRAVLTVSGALFALLFVCPGALAVGTPIPPGPTLYEQEGTAADGYQAIDASGRGPSGDATDNYTNWKYQYGSYAWFGVYSWDEDAWVEETDTGDGQLEIEADIEVYSFGSFASPTGAGGWMADVSGHLVSNGGQYVGISVDSSKQLALMPRELDVPLRENNVPTDTPEANVALSMNGGPWRLPREDGWPQSTGTQNTAWWLVADGASGAHTVRFQMRGLRDQAEPDSGLAPTIWLASVL